MPVPLRADFDALGVRALAKKSRDSAQARRLLAAIYEGASRTDAAKLAGVTLQIIRDWVVKFNASGPEGLIDRKGPGRASLLSEDHRKALAGMIESGPTPAVHGVVRWRIVDLCHWLFEEFRVSVSKQTLSRQLRAMGYRKLTARPRHHAQAEGAIEDFKKKLPCTPTRGRAEGWRQPLRPGNLVLRRRSHRTEKQDRAPLGQAGNEAIGSARSAHRLNLHLRCDLSQRGKRQRTLFCPYATYKR